MEVLWRYSRDIWNQLTLSAEQERGYAVCSGKFRVSGGGGGDWLWIGIL